MNELWSWLEPKVPMIVVVVTLAIVKLLWAIAEDPPDGETAAGKRRRNLRNVAGMMSGLVVAYAGTEPLMEYFDLSSSLQIPLAGALVLLGEHLVRRLLAPGQLIDALLERVLGLRRDG